MSEIVRCVRALQLASNHPVCIPANWPKNHAKITKSNGTKTSEYKGSVYLIPSVSKEEADEKYPGHHTCVLPSGTSYLRLAKPETVGIKVSDKRENETAEQAKAASKKGLLRRFLK